MEDRKVSSIGGQNQLNHSAGEPDFQLATNKLGQAAAVVLGSVADAREKLLFSIDHSPKRTFMFQ